MRKGNSQTRNRTLQIRLTDKEYQTISDNAIEKGYLTPSDYARSVLTTTRRSCANLTKAVVTSMFSIQDRINDLYQQVQNPKDSNFNAKLQNDITDLYKECLKIWRY